MTSYSEYDRGYENGVQDTLDENPPLKWTTEPPTKNGWYGATFLEEDIVVEYKKSIAKDRVWFSGTHIYLKEITRWTGPIRLPGDEK
ncbi:MAG: hypothetical protein KJ604_20035 [Gammaproteobacteria bacterium]|nr:hypothetical protein [Gammaproteobacteria bacterium]